MGQSNTRVARVCRESTRRASRKTTSPTTLVDADGAAAVDVADSLTTKAIRVQDFQAAFIRRFGKEEVPIDVFVEFYRSAVPDNQANPLSKHLVRQLHRNKDRVRLTDLVWLLEVLEYGSEDEKAVLLFSLFDLDGNGRIDEIEFLQIVRDSYTYSRRFKSEQGVISKTPVPADERIRFTFNNTDVNSDGVLSRTEFADACTVNRDVCDVALTCLRGLLREVVSKL